jgi:hypothetical protein
VTTERRHFWILLAAWLAIGAAMTVLSWGPITRHQFPDQDDVMRLLELRDWLAGQSWFDVTQYRLNPPAGASMHWSRLVDVPLAAVVMLARPFAGEAGAETAAIIAVPLLTLGIAMLLVQRIGEKLMGPGAALAAAIATPFSLGGIKQMRPMRIDHHGWQIVLALVATLAAMDDRPRRSGFVAGLAMAAWMNISVEGLPFAAALGALFAWQWIADASATERIKAYLASLALSSAILFAATHSASTWLSQPRDVITVAHLGAFAVAWASCAFVVRRGTISRSARIGALAGAGAATAAAMFAIDPHWLRGPFGSLDPLVREMWYDRITEGLPMWRVGWSEAAIGLAQPLVGLLGGALALRGAQGRERKRWIAYVVALGAITLASLFVLRIESTSSVIALPGTAFLCASALGRARSVSLFPLRVVASAAAVFIMTPAYAVPLSMTPANTQTAREGEAGIDCVGKSEVDALRMLPTADIAAPLEIAPAILLETQHRAIASGHHRNAGGMRDVIELFVLPPQSGARILARRRSDYLVFCPGSPEAISYAHRGPNGLAAMLRSGHAPRWLEPVIIPGLHELRVWRVRKDLLAAA